MRLARVQIPCASVMLAGLVYEPRKERCPICVVFSHGFTASKESLDLLAAYVCARGYHCVSFDFRGHKLGGSTGDMERAEDAVEDLTAVAEWTMERCCSEKCILVGHSMGALMSLAVASRMPEVAGAAAVATGPKPTAGFAHPIGMALLSQRADYVTGAPVTKLLEEMDMLAAGWHGLGGRPALFVGSTEDAMVKAARVREMAARCGPNAEFVEIDGTHLEAPSRARGVVADWLDRTFRR